MEIVQTHRGTSPVILAFPHAGTNVPADIWSRLNENGRKLADTDWHLDRLYGDLLPSVTTVRAVLHRYVIDVNRDPQRVSLYPGQNTTALVPETDFDGLAIWNDGDGPTEDDIVDRLETYHAPYHAALSAEIDRIRAIHGVAVLYDCHSIRSHIPYLFDGTLPDLNIGSNNGTTCAQAFERAAVARAGNAAGYTSVLNGRFKGGWTTRHYGQPANGVHAIQMELAQSTYLKTEEPPFAFDPQKAEKIRCHLTEILADLQSTADEFRAQGN